PLSRFRPRATCSHNARAGRRHPGGACRPYAGVRRSSRRGLLHFGSGMIRRPMRTTVWMVVPAILSAWAMGAAGSRDRSRESARARANPAAVTFTRDIAPILFHSCAPCHHPGEAAPFSLLRYTDAKTHAAQIAAVTRARIMPPWLPEAGEFAFVDDLRLTTEQIARLQAWVDQGTVEGDPADLPAEPRFAEGWQLGKPDVITHARNPYLLPPRRPHPYSHFL